MQVVVETVMLVAAGGCGEQFHNVPPAVRAAEPETAEIPKCTESNKHSSWLEMYETTTLRGAVGHHP
jgi:hypothetical protein